MLVAMCIAAICLQLPYMILYTVNDRKSSWWPGRDGSALYAWIYTAMEIAEMISITNYAVNFFLYCVSGSAFRHHVYIHAARGRRRSSSSSALAFRMTTAVRYSIDTLRIVGLIHICMLLRLVLYII